MSNILKLSGAEASTCFEPSHLGRQTLQRLHFWRVRAKAEANQAHDKALHIPAAAIDDIYRLVCFSQSEIGGNMRQPFHAHVMISVNCCCAFWTQLRMPVDTSVRHFAKLASNMTPSAKSYTFAHKLLLFEPGSACSTLSLSLSLSLYAVLTASVQFSSCDMCLSFCV